MMRLRKALYHTDPGERGGSVVEHRLRSERSGVRNLPPLCCVLEQDTFYSPKVLVIPRGASTQTNILILTFWTDRSGQTV